MKSEDLIELARKKVKGKKYNEAISLFKKAFEQNPKNFFLQIQVEPHLPYHLQYMIYKRGLHLVHRKLSLIFFQIFVNKNAETKEIPNSGNAN